MTCRQVETLVDEVAASRTSSAIDLAVRAHVDQCQSCHRALREAEALRVLMSKASERFAPSYGFTGGVRQRIAERHIRPRALDRALAWMTVPVAGGAVLAAVACLAAALVLPGKLHRGETMRVASSPPLDRPPLVRLLDATAVDRSAVRNDEREAFRDPAVGDIAKAEATRYLRELKL